MALYITRTSTCTAACAGRSCRCAEETSGFKDRDGVPVAVRVEELRRAVLLDERPGALQVEALGVVPDAGVGQPLRQSRDRREGVGGRVADGFGDHHAFAGRLLHPPDELVADVEEVVEAAAHDHVVGLLDRVGQGVVQLRGDAPPLDRHDEVAVRVEAQVAHALAGEVVPVQPGGPAADVGHRVSLREQLSDALLRAEVLGAAEESHEEVVADPRPIDRRSVGQGEALSELQEGHLQPGQSYFQLQ